MKNLLNIEDFEITVKLKNKNNMRAQVGITYGPINIYGYRIMQSSYDDNLFVQPPSIKSGNNWLQLVRINDPELWRDLEEKIINAYNQKVKKPEDENEEEVTVDPRDIPI